MKYKLFNPCFNGILKYDSLTLDYMEAFAVLILVLMEY